MATEQSSCPCCGCQSWTNAGRIRESFAASEPARYLPVLTCERCGVRRLALSPSPQWVEEWYANAPYGLRARSESWPHRLKMLLETSDSRLASAVRQATVVTWLPRPPFDGAKMLDVGCASGDLMAHATRLGWTPTGCEASDASCAVARSRGFECHSGNWQANLPVSEYDLVTLSHVLEHLPSPGATLACLRRSMTAKAVLLCTVPNWHGAMARTFGAEWWANNPPEHIWLLRPRDTGRRDLGARRLQGRGHPPAIQMGKPSPVVGAGLRSDGGPVGDVTSLRIIQNRVCPQIRPHADARLGRCTPRRANPLGTYLLYCCAA